MTPWPDAAMAANALRAGATRKVTNDANDARDFARAYLDERVRPAKRFSLSFAAMRRIKIALPISALVLVLLLGVGHVENLLNRQQAAPSSEPRRIAIADRRATPAPAANVHRASKPRAVVPPEASPAPLATAKGLIPLALAPPRAARPHRKSATQSHAAPPPRHRRPASAHDPSRWIADPLYGAALRKALVEDRRLTAQANEAQTH